VDIHPTFHDFCTAEICENETYEFYGQVLDTAGTYSENFQTINGCDSIEELILIVNPLPTISIDPFNPDSVGLNSGLVNLPNVTPAGGTFSGTGVSGNFFDPTIVNLGTYWISYFYTDQNTGCSNSDSIQITVFDDTGIENPENPEVEIFPIPSTGIISVELSQSFENVKVYDALGNQIIKRKLTSGEKQFEIDLSKFPAGIYFIELENNEAKISRKIVILEK
jgi:hypothetical protein